MAVDQHYENFPVASILIPSAIRPFVVAIYRFARHADDVADEGDDDAPARFAALDALDNDVHALFDGGPVNAPTVRALAPLRDAHFKNIDERPFRHLLSAFRQDVATREYPDFDALMDYCRRSANPVGRLMLALANIHDEAAKIASDHICSALQLINFWQDAALDASRGRIYVPQEDFLRFGTSSAVFPKFPEHRELMRFQCERTELLMQAGVPLLSHLSGRFLLEIALTVAGGQRILEIVKRNDYDVRIRPTLRWYDSPRLLFLAARALLQSRRPSP